MTIIMFDVMLIAHYGFHATFPIWLWYISVLPIGVRFGKAIKALK